MLVYEDKCDSRLPSNLTR